MKDLMLLNGKIHTINPDFPKAEAVAIRDGKIIAVGKNSEVENLGRKNFQFINLEGKTVIPGLIDCHTHFLSFAFSLKKANLQKISSFEELLSVVKSFSKKLKPGEWLRGDGWDKNILGDESMFTKEILDRVCPQSPVALQSKDHHLLWVNSRALKLAGIDKSTNDPPGGRIKRDSHTGEPTGLLIENACDLIWKKIPPFSKSVTKELVKEAMKIANSYGLTGIHNFDEHDAFDIFQQLSESGELTFRVCLWIPYRDLDSFINLGLKSGFGNENLRFGGVKLYGDGTLGSQTALVFEPYQNSKDNFGIEVTSEEELTHIAKKASQAGISVAIHAIGDKGVHQALNAIESSLEHKGKDTRLRHRIEHVQLLHPQDKERFRKLGVIASVQPVHAPSDREIAEKYWGKRCNLAYAYKTLLKDGARLVFGSDAPIETLDPLKGIYSAVLRKKAGQEKSWYPKEKLSVKDVVFAYTQQPSYASYEEDLKGSIEIGKLGDLVILSHDIFEIEPERISDTKVECTILGGKIVFQA
jgi:predicted amidohydrolase YtcJ